MLGAGLHRLRLIVVRGTEIEQQRQRVERKARTLRRSRSAARSRRTAEDDS
jgi:hypothetical protein